MNRLVLIGNGFDIAHGLPTRYEEFINWYCDQRVEGFVGNLTDTSSDLLCTFQDLRHQVWNVNAYSNGYNLKKAKGKKLIDDIIGNVNFFKTTMVPFFANIYLSIETKGWVDIENEYYELLKKFALQDNDATKVEELNKQLHFLQDKLVEYISLVNKEEVKPVPGIKSAIYSPFNQSDISIDGMHALEEHVKYGLKLDDKSWEIKIRQYESICYTKGYVDSYKEKNPDSEKIDWECIPKELLLPNQIMLLNFNYTKTAELYCPNDKEIFSINHIHGKVENSKSVIFGYGDEIDEKYKELEKKNDDLCLSNIKSIKYLEADNYRKVRSFIESEPYQIIIMGHSCGNSDRTLLNTLFEHPNCVSVKPYYYIDKKGKDNYLKLVMNISRNFNDKKLMRDRVVSKVYCKPMSKP
jgi:hypothetical protein